MKKLYLLSNAHIDPVWQWRWQEGVGTAITTFSAAADFCEEFDQYIFCHNEAILYQWVEENAPELFARIQKLVAQGKWFIMGGWYLQPDCNMPSGESFIRQIRAGLDYFSAKFPGFKRPDVAINFDSFGHTNGLVQILQDAGYKGYVCMRPYSGLTNRNFLWKGYADSEIVVYRVFDAYNTLLGQVDKRLEPFILKLGDMEEGLFLWGVGNHGGGPSRQDYRIIGELQKKYPEIQFIHSTPDEYFREIYGKKDTLEEVKELNYSNMGCYTSMIRIKQLHQKLENELSVAEKMAAHAGLSGSSGDHSALARAEQDLMFCEFHDILPGSCIKSAEDDALAQLSHGIAEAQRVQMKAFFALAGGQPKAAAGEYPILVYNPHPFAVRKTLECEFMLADQNWSEEEFYEAELFCNGEKIPSQFEKEESSIPLDWRKRAVFTLEMPPFSMNRVSVFTRLVKKKPQRPGDIREDFLFDNGNLLVRIGARSGLLESVCVGGTEYLKNAGSLRVIRNCCDPWGFNYDDYREYLGSFTLLNDAESAAFAKIAGDALCPVRVIEDGEVRTVVEALFGYGSSRAAVRYTLPKEGTEVRVHIDLYNAEKDVKLKFRIASALKNCELKGKTAFGMNDLPVNGCEVVAQDYVVLSDGEQAVSAIHFGTYGLCAEDGNVDMTLLNSSAYCAHPIDDRTIMRADRFGARIDQGERNYDFVLNFGGSAERFASIEAESQFAHQPPYAVSFFPTGGGKACERFITLSNSSVALTSVHKSRDRKNMVIRLYNSLQQKNKTSVIVPACGVNEEISFKPYEFKTFLVESGRLIPCNCLEDKIK